MTLASCAMYLCLRYCFSDYTGYLIWGSIATIFMVLFPLICYYQSWKKIKKLERKIAEANAGKFIKIYQKSSVIRQKGES